MASGSDSSNSIFGSPVGDSELEQLRAKYDALVDSHYELRASASSSADVLAAIAQNALAFGFTEQGAYERERIDEILQIAASLKIAAQGANTSRVNAEIVEQWKSEVVPGNAGYVTPKVGVAAIVADDRARLLLVQRSDSARWFLPSGFCDIGLNPAENCIKEVEEETGIVARPTAVVRVGNHFGYGTAPQMTTLYFKCEMTGGQLATQPHECLDARFFSREDVQALGAENLVRKGVDWLNASFEAISPRRHGEIHCEFDSPRPENLRISMIQPVMPDHEGPSL